jgi:hypothetical protein
MYINQKLNGVIGSEYSEVYRIRQTWSAGAEVTRAMLVAQLYRLAGNPETELTTRFTDVTDETPYSRAISWAVANGITNGTVQGIFAPYVAVTRQQLAVFIHNYYGNPIVTDEISFTDFHYISDWAMDGMMFAISNSYFQMYGNTNPNAAVTRAELNEILLRLSE